METVLTVGFILTAAAFFTKVFGLRGYWSLLAAGIVGVLTTLYPVFLASYPQVGVIADPIIKVIALVVAAAGAHDFTKDMASQPAVKQVK